MKKFFAFLISSTLLLALAMPVSAATKSTKSAVPPSPSAADLQAKYANALTSGQKVRILVVPGHEPGYGGTEYQGFYEREMVLEIAEKFALALKANPRYEVITTRTATEGWTPTFAEYLAKGEKATKKFVDAQKKIFTKKLKKGTIEERTEEAAHAAAPAAVALRLYGVNRWANENDIDLVVHLHINDAGGVARTSYSGYAVYVPDAQYANGPASVPVAHAIANRLSLLSSTSTLPAESKGVVEDQELIAIGAFDTLSAPSVLIEYGYIVEEKFLHTETRRAVSTDYAYDTYRGLQDFFNDPVPAGVASLTLPHAWTEGKIAEGASVETYALQAALRTLGFYPGVGQNRLVCPISGVVNPCTEAALKAFQASKNLEQTGAIGPKTKAALTAAGV